MRPRVYCEEVELNIRELRTRLHAWNLFPFRELTKKFIKSRYTKMWDIPDGSQLVISVDMFMACDSAELDFRKGVPMWFKMVMDGCEQHRWKPVIFSSVYKELCSFATMDARHPLYHSPGCKKIRRRAQRGLELVAMLYGCTDIWNFCVEEADYMARLRRADSIELCQCTLKRYRLAEVFHRQYFQRSRRCRTFRKIWRSR